MLSWLWQISLIVMRGVFDKLNQNKQNVLRTTLQHSLVPMADTCHTHERYKLKKTKTNTQDIRFAIFKMAKGEKLWKEIKILFMT